MGQVKLIGSLLMVALFSIALITFAVQFAGDNETSFTIDDELSDRNDQIQSNLEIYDENINASSQQFSESETTTGDSFGSGAVFKGGNIKLMASVIPIIWAGFGQIFGFGSGFSIFFTALVSFLTFLFIMYTYKAWIGRNPD